MAESQDIKFYKKAGRPAKYATDEEKKKARLEAKRKWYKKQDSQARVKEYNKQYYSKKQKLLSRLQKNKSKSKPKSKSNKHKRDSKTKRHTKSKTHGHHKSKRISIDKLLDAL
jgi:hypothetical protein